ncbi:hypothetical protein Adt_38873 [Abeliophyllum distichum]|uniref:Secreted protein n=1 Tax=Abeliophyllum distichum TaxID=126358 RepID=A0ABD1Q4J3_9LAMI
MHAVFLRLSLLRLGFASWIGEYCYSHRSIQVWALIANKIGVVMIIIVKHGLIRRGSTNGGAVDSNSVIIDFTRDFECGLIVRTLEGVIFARTRFTDDVAILLLEPPQILD